MQNIDMLRLELVVEEVVKKITNREQVSAHVSGSVISVSIDGVVVVDELDMAELRSRVGLDDGR